MKTKILDTNGSGLTIVKEIPLKSIISVGGTNPRQEVITSRVDLFKTLYQDPQCAVDPIEVLSLRDSTKYALLDGLHRLRAKVEMRKSQIPARIREHPAYFISDLNTKEVKGAILELACPINAKSAMPLKLEERIAAARELFNLGYSEERIAAALCAGNRTVRRWLSNVKRKHREELKTIVNSQFRNGAATRKVARDLGLPESTLRGWEIKREATVRENGHVASPAHTKHIATATGGGSSEEKTADSPAIQGSNVDTRHLHEVGNAQQTCSYDIVGFQKACRRLQLETDDMLLQSRDLSQETKCSILKTINIMIPLLHELRHFLQEEVSNSKNQ